MIEKFGLEGQTNLPNQLVRQSVYRIFDKFKESICNSNLNLNTKQKRKKDNVKEVKNTNNNENKDKNICLYSYNSRGFDIIKQKFCM